MAPWGRSVVFSEGLLSSPDSSTPHSWNAEIHLLRSDLGPLPYTTVWLVSEFLTLVALLVFLPAACTAKQSSCGATASFPSLAVIASIVSYILSQILSVILLLVEFLEATVKQSYVVIGILQMIFRLLALLLLFYALYRVVHGILERIAFPTGLLALVRNGHWGVLGICSLLVIANCAVRIASIVRTVESSEAGGIAAHDERLTTSRAVLFMIMSLEILLWAIFPVVKVPGSELPHSKTGLVSLTISCLSYLVLTLTSAIRTIRYMYLHVPQPGYTNAACAVVQFFSVVGIYTGLIMFYLQLEKDETAARQSRLRQRMETKPYIPYRPSIGEVLSQPGHSPKVFGTDGTWVGSSDEAFMSGGR
ncbi:hypothetical protein P170DRAFT_436314 [Aspergillus steynii IBT 23096]|uniref:Integral membrane protein n=1 Tax=Aspergillus steynii IBT 23096 TaxID=1392250 RepID=A0A2I2GEI6_9EURO|nr:uncharacterized protein P170DRAFT_436314 [Aspergillus steynii IBT 23096]PLB51247.1 hypothetical protein P170DRAFT_436314 [Aspergillus steynii IBT 23096]